MDLNEKLKKKIKISYTSKIIIKQTLFFENHLPLYVYEAFLFVPLFSFSGFSFFTFSSPLSVSKQKLIYQNNSFPTILAKNIYVLKEANIAIWSCFGYDLSKTDKDTSF